MIADVNNFGIITSDEEKQSRRSLCDACPEKSSEICQKCACPIAYVVMYRFKICPLDKWGV